MDTLQVKRDGDRDLEFQGTMLTKVSSRKAQEPRWTEIAIYKTDKGKFVVEVVGRTEMDGEYNRHRAEVCTAPQEVYDALLVESPGGWKYLSWIAKEALEQVGASEPILGALLKERL